MSKDTRRKRKFDYFWEEIFETYDVINKIDMHNTFRISTDTIKEHKGEPRLLVKFDHRNNRPYIFNDNDISILPDSRYGYILGKFDLYADLDYQFKNSNPEDDKTKIVSMPYYIESIKFDNLTSEAISLHAAQISGILEDFLSENILQTVSGRTSTKKMSFEVGTMDGEILNFQVDGSQIEIDGGYESLQHLTLVEAKQHFASDFLIRQLYYPFRTFYDRGLNKKIRNIYMTYSNDMFTLFEYVFTNPLKYNSLKIVKRKSYVINFEGIAFRDILHAHRNVEFVEEPTKDIVPFPQADTFERVIDFLTILLEKDLTFDEMTGLYDFDPRQSDYYKNSAKYLDLIDEFINEQGEKTFTLNEKGKRIMESDPKTKYIEIIKLIFSHKPFHETFTRHLLKNSKDFRKVKLSNIEVGSIISKYFLGYNDTTYNRRGGTVKGWIRWMIRITEKYNH